ncbi:MAG: IS21 family transposase [Gemmatimonadales bacterium]
MKSAREYMDIVHAYQELGSYRAAAALCGTTPKTVKRVMARRERGPVDHRRAAVPLNTAGVTELIAERVRSSDGRISAKRLLPPARAAGYTGSERNFRRAVARAKAAWRVKRRTYRPWVPTPGEYLVIDWGVEAGVQIFCAVLAWSRYRFVRFATDQRRETTLQFLAECFAELGGVPARVLADRMGCLKGGTVANVVVPNAAYVRFATHFGFRPDFCEAADPESKGVVEALVGYAKRDLVIPSGGWSSIADANVAAKVWGTEVNGRVHSETMAAPAERLVSERTLLRALPSLRPPLRRGELRTVDRLRTVRFGSARYSAPAHLIGRSVEVVAYEGTVVITYEGAEVARHAVVAPGEVALDDAHYEGKRVRPTRAIRPRSASEIAFLALGEVAEAFLRAAAAAGTARLAGELVEIVELEASWGKAALTRAVERAVVFRRFKAADVRTILLAGDGVPTITSPGADLALGLPVAPTRDLDAYALAAIR